MMRLLAATLSVLFAVAPLAATSAPLDDVQAALDARTRAIPGSAIVAAVIDNGRVRAWQSGVSGTDRPLDAQTLFEIGSVTKTMTATVLAEMVLGHRVSLDEPVQRLLPPAMHVPQRNGKQITLLELATQHSGLPRLPTNFTTASSDDPYARYGEQQLAQFLNSYTLPRDPGAEYEYSNLGFGLLGYALAHRAKTSYESLLLDRVFRPLGMSGTRISFAMGDGRRLASGHTPDGQPASSWSFQDTFAGAGAVKSDLDDMIAYTKAAMGQGPLGAAMRFAEQPRTTFPGGRIGLAWMTASDGEIWHDGKTAGYQAEVRVSADRTRGVVVLSSGPETDDIAAHLMRPSVPLQLADTWDRTPSATELQAYAGRYASSDGAVKGNVFEKDGSLFVQLDGQPAGRIRPSHYPDWFYNAEAGAYFDFVRRSDVVVGTILMQGRSLQLFRLGSDGKPLATQLSPTFPSSQMLATADAAAYAGTYRSATGLSLSIVAEGGQLRAKLGSQAAYDIYEQQHDVFFYKVVDAQLAFERDAAGRVTSVTLHQAGKTYTFERTNDAHG